MKPLIITLFALSLFATPTVAEPTLTTPVAATEVSVTRQDLAGSWKVDLPIKEDNLDLYAYFVFNANGSLTFRVEGELRDSSVPMSAALYIHVPMAYTVSDNKLSFRKTTSNIEAKVTKLDIPQDVAKTLTQNGLSKQKIISELEKTIRNSSDMKGIVDQFNGNYFTIVSYEGNKMSCSDDTGQVVNFYRVGTGTGR